MKNRRGFLTVLGSVGVAAIAGCSNNREGDLNGNKSSSNEINSSSPSITDSQNVTSSTPESVTRQFWEALANGNYEVANELLHPGSLNYPLDESEITISDDEVRTVEEVSYNEASERIPLASEEELDEAIQDRTGLTDYTLVYVELSDGETVTPVVEADGELKTVYLR